MNKSILGIQLAGLACAVMLTGCATNEQGQLVVDPDKFNAVIVAAVTPTPQPVIVAAPVVEEAYVPAPTDIYIAAATDHDVVFVGGDTYIWMVDADGHRHRHFYGHGDRRQDVFHRRDDLHSVMARHDGHLPDHPVGGHALAERPGVNHPPVAGQVHPGPGGAPVNRAVVASKPAAKPAPSKDTKKS